MAGAGYKLYATGDVLTAADVNSYLQEQTVMRFASAAARTSALASVLAEGMLSYLIDTDAVEVYNGSAWVGVANAGDITGVTAGTGISGGGTSGTVTITNSMATAITTAGDLIKGTGSGTFDRLGIGSTGQVLTVSAGAPAWATPSGGGGMTSIASGSLSGNTLSLTSISGSYKDLQLVLRDVSIDAQSALYCTFNGLSANYFDSNYGHHTTTTAYNEGNVNRTFATLGGYENQVANTTVTAHVLDFYDYTSSDVKICRKSGYIDGRFSTPYLYNSTFGNYAAGARAAITSITITIVNGGNFNGGTYILYGVS